MTPHAFVNQKLQRFTIGAKARAGSNLFWSILLELAAWSVYAVSAILFLIFIWASASVILLAVPIALVVVATRLRRKAKRYRIDLQGKLLNDPRDPILYLRSFDDDQIENTERADKKTCEELLASVLDDAGPVVAVGKPGETLPLLGATRLYFNDADWQTNVQYLMSISQLVTVQADISEGLEWELGVATKTLSPERLLISFLSWRAYDEDTRRSLYDRFRKRVEKLVKWSLPGDLNDADFLYFESDWTGRMAEVGQCKKLFFKVIETFRFRNRGVSVTRIRESLRPILRKRGLRLGIGRTFFDVLLLVVFIAYAAWFLYSNYANGLDENTFKNILFLISTLAGAVWVHKRKKDATITLNLR